ncbi:MAG: hypothetical protein EBX72_07095 [Betaproteobacteria bacterium]|nr:hypothetical protein [Betaproteobacteria bacterium]
MKFKELRIVGLSYSQTQEGSYVIVLSEKDGPRKVPIIIKSNDAQFIALKMEEVTRFRMTTHPIEFDMYYSL